VPSQYKTICRLKNDLRPARLLAEYKATLKLRWVARIFLSPPSRHWDQQTSMSGGMRWPIARTYSNHVYTSCKTPASSPSVRRSSISMEQGGYSPPGPPPPQSLGWGLSPTVLRRKIQPERLVTKTQIA